MGATSKLWIAVGVAVVLGAGAGAGAVVVAGSGTRSTTAAQIRELQTKVDKQDRIIVDLTAALRERKTSEAPTDSSEPTLPAPTPTKRVREYAYIRSIKPTGAASLVADYAQFLTGKAAAKAAAAAGDESPPPNDYYVVNANPKLRTLPVSPTVKVTLSTKPGDNPEIGGYASTLAELAEYLADDNEASASLRADGFWLILENGTVTGITEQYQP